MRTTIQKWGNSHALRLPKHILDELKLKENDQLEVSLDGGAIVIKKAHEHKTFEERMAGYSGTYVCSEWDTGEPFGQEIW